MIEKLKYLVTEICKKNNDNISVEIIENSEFVPNVRNRNKQHTWENYKYDLTFNVNPLTYIKHSREIDRVEGIIKYLFNQVNDKSELSVEKIIFKPNYDKIAIHKSEIAIIETPWEDINTLQKKIIENINISNSSIDFQNIGNTSRTIMDKISRLVFNPEIHVPPKNIDVSNGKFKNQLHTYVSCVLKGEANKELRRFSESAINFIEKAIDLMNQTTHKLDVQKHFAEVCVISTISVVSLIKTINEI